MNYEQINNNRLQLTGVVCEEPVFSHEVFGEGFYESKLSVPRLSQQVDIIPITVSERLLAESNVAVGDRVSVEGQFRSYNKMIGDRSKLCLTAFVRELTPADDERNPNEIEITGYICKEPVYRTTPFNREICDVLLAVNRAYNKSDYIPCIMWGRNARFLRHMPVGEKLTVYGRIQSRVYVKSLDGVNTEERVAYEVSAGRIVLADKENLRHADELSQSIMN